MSQSAEREVMRLRMALERAMDREQKLEIELANAGGSQGVAAEMEELARRNAHLEEELEEARAETARVKNSPARGGSGSREEARLRGALERKMDEVLELRALLEEAQEDKSATPLKSRRNRIATLEDELDAAREAAAEAQRRSEEDKSRRYEAEDREAELITKVAALQTALELKEDELEDEVSNYEFKIAKFKREKQEDREEIEEMQRELTRERSSRLLTDSPLPTRARDTAAEEKLRAERAKVEELRGDVERLREELQAAQADTKRSEGTHKGRVGEMEIRVKALTQQVSFLEEENKRALQRAADHKEANALLKEELTDLQEQLDDDLIEIGALKKELAKYR